MAWPQIGLERAMSAIPAKAGISLLNALEGKEIPAFAGMTGL
jgi:hypothetical protein